MDLPFFATAVTNDKFCQAKFFVLEPCHRYYAVFAAFLALFGNF